MALPPFWQEPDTVKVEIPFGHQDRHAQNTKCGHSATGVGPGTGILVGNSFSAQTLKPESSTQSHKRMGRRGCLERAHVRKQEDMPVQASSTLRIMSPFYPATWPRRNDICDTREVDRCGREPDVSPEKMPFYEATALAAPNTPTKSSASRRRRPTAHREKRGTCPEEAPYLNWSTGPEIHSTWQEYMQRNTTEEGWRLGLETRLNERTRVFDSELPGQRAARSLERSLARLNEAGDLYFKNRKRDELLSRRCVAFSNKGLSLGRRMTQEPSWGGGGEAGLGCNSFTKSRIE